MRKRVRYIIKKTVKGIFSAILVLFIVLVPGSTTFRRYITMGMAEVYDFRYLPVKKIEAVDSNYSFIDCKTVQHLTNITYNGNPVGEFEEFLEQNRTTAFIIVRNDSIIYENYFNGHKQDSVCKVFSITKNIISTLIGIALDKGQISGIHDPVIQYVPEIKNKGTDNLTLYHCLNGTSGVKYLQNYFPWSDEARMYYSPDIRRLLYSLKSASAPGTNFRTENYSALILGWVLEKATGSSVTEYLQKNLWQPLGMGHYGYFVLDSKRSQFEKTESGLIVRPIDLAKFGKLWLDEGKWEGKQLVPVEWIKTSLSLEKENRTGVIWASGSQTEYYKNMWWCFSANNKIERYSANGHFGQRLVVVPGKNLIILRLGTANGDVNWGVFISQLIDIL